MFTEKMDNKQVSISNRLEVFSQISREVLTSAVQDIINELPNLDGKVDFPYEFLKEIQNIRQCMTCNSGKDTMQITGKEMLVLMVCEKLLRGFTSENKNKAEIVKLLTKNFDDKDIKYCKVMSVLFADMIKLGRKKFEFKYIPNTPYGRRAMEKLVKSMSSLLENSAIGLYQNLSYKESPMESRKDGSIEPSL